ncbi:hypothetical protein Anapl_03933 [Anas platyrhynchos]|uniref:Uncharacterized protein n=1 Tax=Anas platyrhynchos TaxID=8839 RepID=R0LHI7_ANAPL|nr:hypothetical protein Anapl_03933 [Anas platyrhynchos]
MKHQRRKAKPVLNASSMRLLFVQAHAPQEHRTRTLTCEAQFCNQPIRNAAQRTSIGKAKKEVADGCKPRTSTSSVSEMHLVRGISMIRSHYCYKNHECPSLRKNSLPSAHSPSLISKNSLPVLLQLILQALQAHGERKTDCMPAFTFTFNRFMCRTALKIQHGARFSLKPPSAGNILHSPYSFGHLLARHSVSADLSSPIRALETAAASCRRHFVVLGNRIWMGGCKKTPEHNADNSQAACQEEHRFLFCWEAVDNKTVPAVASIGGTNSKASRLASARNKARCSKQACPTRYRHHNGEAREGNHSGKLPENASFYNFISKDAGLLAQTSPFSLGNLSPFLGLPAPARGPFSGPACAGTGSSACARRTTATSAPNPRPTRLQVAWQQHPCDAGEAVLGLMPAYHTRGYQPFICTGHAPEGALLLTNTKDNTLSSDQPPPEPLLPNSYFINEVHTFRGSSAVVLLARISIEGIAALEPQEKSQPSLDPGSSVLSSVRVTAAVRGEKLLIFGPRHNIPPRNMPEQGWNSLKWLGQSGDASGHHTSRPNERQRSRAALEDAVGQQPEPTHQIFRPAELDEAIFTRSRQTSVQEVVKNLLELYITKTPQK